MPISSKQLAGIQSPEILTAQQIVNGDPFAATPEMIRRSSQEEESFAGATRKADYSRYAGPAELLESYNVENMLEPSSNTRRRLRAARAMAYARDILARPDNYSDGDAESALNELSLGFSREVSEWKRLKGMTDDPRRNLDAYLSMIDGLGKPENLASAEQPSPFARYYEATRSDEPRRWETLNGASLDDRYNHAIANSPETSRRFTDAAKDWVHSAFFDEDRITPEEEEAWIASEGGYGSESVRRFFGNRDARNGKSARDILRDRETWRATAAKHDPRQGGDIPIPREHADTIPSFDTKANLRIDPKTGKTTADDLHLENLTLEEYAEAEKRRDTFVAKRRAVEAYQKRMDEQTRRDRAHAMLPFLTDNEAAVALAAMRGEDLSKYRGFFANGFGNDAERRSTVIDVCSALRPKNAHGAWEDLLGRAAESTKKAFVDIPKIAALKAAKWRADTPEEHAEFDKLKREIAFDVGYRRALESWVPNDDEDFLEQAMKGLADSGFLQTLSVGGAVASIAGTSLLASPHPAAKIGGTALNLAGLAADALGSASMIAESFENLVTNGVDAERAASLSVPAGIVNWYIEKGPVDVLLGKGLSPAELKRLGWRALFKTLARHDWRLVASALRTDAKQISRSLVAECGEELLQAANDEGFVRFAKGEARNIVDGWLSKDAVRAGVDAFIDAIPTCTAFGAMSVSHPLSSKNGQAVDAYRQLADETARRFALRNNLDATRKEDMAKARRLILENAARHARATQGMDADQRRAYFENAVGEEGMSPSEASFYTEASNLYSVLAQMEGQQFADAAVHGEISEAVLDRAGIRLGHDEAGNINSVTVDGHTRAIVTDRGTEEVTDSHTGQKNSYKGAYNPEDDSIHITVPISAEDVGKTAEAATIPHELLHATLEALASDPALPAETRATLDKLLTTKMPDGKADANEAAAQFVENIFNYANKGFTPDREVIALGNIVRNVGIALKKAFGSKSEFLPSIVTKKGEGGISITDLLDPSFLAELDQLQVAAAAEGTANPYVAVYASVMQPFFKALVDTTSRAKTAENLNKAEAGAAAEATAEATGEEKEPRFSLAPSDYKPEKTYHDITGKLLYKTMRLVDGHLEYPMAGTGVEVPTGVWLKADDNSTVNPKTGKRETKLSFGSSKVSKRTGKILRNSGTAAPFAGFHMGSIPYMAHIGLGGNASQKHFQNADYVWVAVDVPMDRSDEYRERTSDYANEDAMRGVVPDNGMYYRKTNPNMKGKWGVAGQMKIVKVLSDDDVDAILDKEAPDRVRMRRQGGGRFNANTMQMEGQDLVNWNLADAEREFASTRFSLNAGDNLSLPSKADEFIEAFKNYSGAKPPRMLRRNDPRSTYEWFKANLLGKTFKLGDRLFKVNAGHYFRFVCETPKDGQRKGWVKKASSAEESRAMIERGELCASDIAGYRPDRAASLPLALEMLTNPDAIMRRTFNRTFKDTVVKKFDTGSKDNDLAVFILNDDGETLGLETVYRRVLNRNILNGNNLIAISDKVVESQSANPAVDGLSPRDNAGDTSLNYADSIPNFPATAQPRYSLASGNPIASTRQPVDYILAHRIFAANGKPPTREETDRLLKAYGSGESAADVLARSVSLAQEINAYLERIGQNPEVVRAVAAAGLALEAKGAQTRAKNALMKFDANAAEARQRIDRAYRRQVDNATGIAYQEMLSYYGLDFDEILKAMEPPPLSSPSTRTGTADGSPSAPYELSEADRAAVDAAVRAIVSRGEGLAAAANAENPGKPEKKPTNPGDSQPDAAETDPAVLRAQAMNAAVVEAVRKSGIAVDNPLAMVALVRRITEDYIRRNPDSIPDFNEADVFSSRVALAQFASNLSQFAQAVARGYSPSHARIRIARLCERLDGRGLATVNQVEHVGEMIFADLNTDIIRQSRADLMRNLHKGDKAKRGEESDPSRWRGLDYYAKKHGVHLAEPDRVVSAFAGNYIRILRRVIELSAAKAAERAAQLQDIIDSFNDTEDKEKYRDYQNALLELDILSAYGALRTKMPAEIADKSAAIRQFVQNDLDALNARKEAFEQKRVALRDAMTAAIEGNPKDNGQMPDKDPSFLYSLVGMLETRARILTSFCKDATKRQQALAAFDQLQRTIFHCSTRERAFLNDAKDEMRDTIKRIFGRFRGKSRIESLLATPVDPKTCNLLDRGGQHTKWKIGNVMQMYVSCVQSDYADNCAAHGRDAAYVQLLKDTIAAADPRLLDLIEAMRNLYAEYGKRISVATLSASGVPIQTPNPLYMPVKPLLLMHGKSGEGRAFHPYAPALSPRVKHGYDFDQSADIMEMWYDRIQQSAHTVGYLELSPLIQGTLQSSHVLEAIHQAWGKDAANKWNDYVFTMLSGRRHDDANMVSATTKASSIVFLWGNIRSNLNQLQAIFTAALSHDIGGIRGLGKNLSFWALKPVDMWQAARDLTATQAFKARYGSDLNMAVANAQRQSKYGIMRKVKSVNKVISLIRDAFDATISVGMKGIEIGDKVGVLTLANVYRAERIALENAGLPPEAASEQAAEKLMLIAENTAQGTTDMNTSDFQNAHGALTRMFLQFKTATLQQLSYEYEAFEDWKHDPTDSKKAVRLFSVLFVNHVLASIVPTAIDAMMTAIFGAIRGDDDKDKEENRRRVIARALARVVTGPLGSILIFGSLVDNAVAVVANAIVYGKVKKPFGNKGSLPADSALAQMVNAGMGFSTKLIEAIQECDTGDVLDAITEMATELGTATAPGRLIKQTQPKKKDRQITWY